MTSEIISINRPLLLIGCGNMGLSLVEGWRAAGMDPASIVVVDRDQNKLQDVYTRLKVIGYESLEKTTPSLTPSVVLLAVKPDMLASNLAMLSKRIQISAAPLVISVAAGKPLAFYEKHLWFSAAVVRVMPNIPVTVRSGMSVCIGNDHVKETQYQIVDTLLQAVGSVSWITDENQMHAVTALSGSGPAYLFYFIECLVKAGTELGLDENLATKLAVETVKGAALMASRSETSLSQLRNDVTSQKGTTAAALGLLMDSSTHGFHHIILKALQAADQRSKELAEE